MKTTSTLIFRHFLLFFAAAFLAANFGANAQTAPPQAKLAAPRINQAIDEAKLAPMHAKVHPLARPEFDRGVVADSQPMNRMMLVLKRSPEQETALLSLMDEQQTKSSPNFHAWLTPGQFGQQFGVADADVQKVTAWLTQKGFTGIKISPGNMFIEFSGTAGLVRSAFHTEMHQFLVKGETHLANTSVPQIPAALSPVVASIHSLHNFRKKSFMHFAKPELVATAKKAAGPQFTFANLCPDPPNGTQPCAAVGPADFKKIYNVPANLDGTGQTIALVARSNVAVSDINQFGTAFGISNLTNFSAANNVVLTGPDPGIMLGDDAEATLDIEWSGAVAPKASIKLVVSDIQASTFIDGVDLSAIYIVTNNLAQIMSESFGACELFANDGLENALWEQAAAQGITAMVSTGDTGSAGCDPDLFANASDLGLQISGTASTPFNVAVGGTDFDDAANPSTFWNATNSGTGLLSAKSYIPEITWNGSVCASAATSSNLNTTCSGIDPNNPQEPDLSAGSGGASSCGTVDNGGNCVPYPKPVWQKLAGLTGMPADTVRDIPDVSLFAAVNTSSNHFYVICLADSLNQNGQPCNLTGPVLNFSGVGGTSASSPAFAGIVALVNQSEVTAGRLKAGEGQGNVNYVLYPLAVKQFGTPALASGCNSSLGPGGINTGCTFNDVTKGNNSVPCVGTSADGNPPNGATPNCSTSSANAIGVLVEPTATTTPAWSTTAGYDLATGLGTLNVTNLIANWGSVTTGFKGSATTVTSTTPATVNVVHGANVTFNVGVAANPGPGTPTGDITLVPQPGVPGAQGTVFATLSAGTATITTDQLPGGTYPVVVHYAGDGTFAASDSSPVSVTVTKEASSASTTMWQYATFPNSTILSPPTAPYGAPYLFRVDVIGSNNQDNQPCSQATVVIPCPTGKVTFTADGNPLNDFLNTATGVSTNSALLSPAGFVEDRVLGSTGLSVGAHSIGASYVGDSSYNASTAPALAITITSAPTQTVVAATSTGQPVTTIAAGKSVTLTASVLTFNSIFGGPSNGAGPTGSITFSSCGTATSCNVTVVPVAASNSAGGATASASLTTPFTTLGTQTITATYSGDTNYSPCTANGTAVGCTLTAAVFTVTATGTVAITSTPLTLSSSTGAMASSTITVTPSGGFTGNVVITATAATLPPGVTCPNSPLTINVTGASPVTGTLNCQVATTSTTLTASNAREDGMFEAKAIPARNATRPAAGGKGWWTFSAGTGFAALFLIFLPGGRKKYRAALGLGLVCILSLTIGCGGGSSTPPPPVLTTTMTHLTVPSGKVASGTAFTFSVAVTGGTPTGLVQLFDGATMIGTAAAVTGGTATPTALALGVGTHAITAHYLGDSTTLASTSGPALNLTVTGSTTIAITTTPAATPAAPAITVTVQ